MFPKDEDRRNIHLAIPRDEREIFIFQCFTKLQWYPIVSLRDTLLVLGT